MIGNKLEPFKFWCQKVLPNVYDDSLSYYEYLCKLNEYLNEVIGQINTLTDNMEDYESDLSAQWSDYKDALNAEWAETKNYIDNYFNNLDVQQEINNKLDQMAQSGALSTLLAPIVGTQIGGVVAEQIDGTVAQQIDGSVGRQIDASVASQIATPVATNVTSWLNSNVDPVGSAVTVDKSLSIEGSASDAFFTGVETKKNALGAKFNIMSSVYEHTGYLTSNGSLGGGDAVHSITTPRIPCKPNEVFWYTGRGEYNAVSVLFYNGDSISSSAQYITGSTAKRKVVIPNNIDGVVFSSYSESNNDVYFNVIGEKGYYNNFKTNTEPRIVKLEKDAEGLATTVKKFTQGTLIDGKYLRFTNGGDIEEVSYSNCACTDYIKVKPNEKVYVTAEAQYSSIVYAIYDYDKNVISYYPSSDTGSTYTTYEFQEVTIPENGYYIRLSVIVKTRSRLLLQQLIHRDNNELIDILNTDSMINSWYDVTLSNTTNEYLNRDCVAMAYANSKLSDYMEVRSGEVVKITGNCADGSRILACYDEDYNLVTCYPDISVAVQSTSWSGELYQIPNGVKYIKISAVYSTNIGLQKRITVANAIVGTSNYLAGKKYIAIGDSFTHGDFASVPDVHDPEIWDSATSQFKTYPWQIANRNNMQFTNLAQNGSKLVDFASNQGYLNIPEDTDYCTIMYGLNDYSASIPIGTADDATADTFCGAWNIILNWINSNRPNMKLGIIICSAYLGGSYRTASETMAKKYGIPFLNLYTDEKVPIFMGKQGVPSAISDVKYNYYVVSQTNSHPNIKAHKFESTFIENFMRGL